jgi:2-polyprenyl-6-methoxyphenol hydroxylase-like FAD-dependent oxidoreductase
LPTWWRKRALLIGDAAHATSPHAGQGASLALEDAMRLGRFMQEGQELDVTFENFESERRPRVERIIGFARRNGNQKREFSPVGAWLRDQMLKLLIRANARGMDWMYAYDPRMAGSTSRHQMSDRRDRQAA